jgi:hypothetical protein
VKNPSGSQISGWWAWYPDNGGTNARRFASREDAYNWTPGAGTKAGPHWPGIKMIMRVAFGVVPDNKTDVSQCSVEGVLWGWSHDMVEVVSVEDQRDRYLKLLEEGLG